MWRSNGHDRRWLDSSRALFWRLHSGCCCSTCNAILARMRYAQLTFSIILSCYIRSIKISLVSVQGWSMVGLKRGGNKRSCPLLTTL
ncbi:hypothetical protein HBI56_196960 [Parastagonospora nodorum]|uniref:Uncharacterized protein n=1 Tax=Phaeosphaeria nodorum (strain SN15 / ATCC MYA-4574 / FGSC 10173) TaxID=321614 RepID=A0A7U2F6S1_PHANO|nr:hypothetical protein HBH56_208920 [Parastagonospora nodorum]QRC99656.1 hypothetical protein JI435_413790 [Parastagonospora nodorum SN15]KAH3923568.1 hypothetical protein HBH54_207790 [Parastagonospora nodorum]KAH3941528.1 hypothetical protein HBH53_199030 [Parastagonospora nodorum]KAH3960368.1 hypothetical protein HBH51_192310 [Parastagonospora nodorum]